MSLCVRFALKRGGPAGVTFFLTCFCIYALLICFALRGDKDLLVLHINDFCYIFLHPERLH